MNDDLLTKHTMRFSGQLESSHAQRWLLAYDVRDPRRLQKVGRYLSKEAMRLQYSVYLMEGSRAQLEGKLEQLKTLIDERQDDVRVYPLGQSTRVWGLGQQFEDGGNMLCDAWLNRMLQDASLHSGSMGQALGV